MKFVDNIVSRVRQQVFDSVIRNNLVYNTCWEDPRIDRQLLQLDEESRLVTLTSAGDNALDYLLESPARIHCVDINPAQNALLELKRAVFEHGSYDLLWNLFGEGRYAGASSAYHRILKHPLSAEARSYWDRHIGYFNPRSAAPSFYFRGTSGTFAHTIFKRLQRKGLDTSVYNLLNANTLTEQQYYFDEIEPHLWTTFSRWLLQRNAAMTLLGVPHGQQLLIEQEVDGGLPAFIHESLKQVFTRQALHDNYFWRVYLTGRYIQSCSPRYLHETHFNKICHNIGLLDINTSSLIKFIELNPGRYTHFNLLDHQDWMARNQRDTLHREWRLLLANSAPGARILFRSAGLSRSFVPDFIYDHVHFEDDRTDALHPYDRVGTYGSTHLAVVDQPL